MGHVDFVENLKLTTLDREICDLRCFTLKSGTMRKMTLSCAKFADLHHIEVVENVGISRNETLKSRFTVFHIENVEKSILAVSFAKFHVLVSQNSQEFAKRDAKIAFYGVLRRIQGTSRF